MHETLSEKVKKGCWSVGGRRDGETGQDAWLKKITVVF
jgi:hypothetical protein